MPNARTGKSGGGGCATQRIRLVRCATPSAYSVTRCAVSASSENSRGRSVVYIVSVESAEGDRAEEDQEGAAQQCQHEADLQPAEDQSRQRHAVALRSAGCGTP